MIELHHIPRELNRLSFHGRMLLWSLRHWAVATRGDRETPACVWSTLAKVWGTPAVVGPVRRLWRTLAVGARQPIVVRSPEDALLSGDEQLIMAAISASRHRVNDIIPWLLADLIGARARHQVVFRVRCLGELARVNGFDVGGVVAPTRAPHQ